MTAPALRVPIAVDMESFQKGMQRTRSLTTTTVKAIDKSFAALNGTLAGRLLSTTAMFMRTGTALKLSYLGIGAAEQPHPARVSAAMARAPRGA